MFNRIHAAASPRRCFIAAIALALLTLAGCASHDEEDFAYAPLAPAMAIDPVDMPDLPPWFTNGEITIAFDPAGSYKLYEGLNRHIKPIERGRWVRVNYASVQLEPYAVGLDARPVRGILEKEGDDLLLVFPKAEPLRGLAGPPRTVEDELFGQWSSSTGETIELRSNMTYMHKPEDRTRSSLSGRWRVEGSTLILQPPTARGQTSEFAIKRNNNALTLEVDDRVLTKG